MHRPLLIPQLDTQEQRECLKSLAGSDCDSRRDKLLVKQHTGTGTWLLKEDSYKRWSQTDDQTDDQTIVWIHGGPGCGKSVLSTFLARHLSENPHETFGKGCLLAYFFCDDKDGRLKTADSILLNLVRQLLSQEPNIVAHFLAEPEYREKKENTSWDFYRLWRVFSRIVQDHKIKPKSLIIDALGMSSASHPSQCVELC
jgi:hypothetical protein